MIFLPGCDFPHREAQGQALMSAPKRRGATCHDFFPAEPEGARNTCDRGPWAAVVLTRLESIDSVVLGSEWQCHKTAFVITTCALRTQPQAVPASLETARADRYIFGPIR